MTLDDVTLDNFMGQAWNDHATDSPGVWQRLPEGLALVTKAGDLPGFAALAVHVSGEHLGRWDDGLAFLGRLEALPVLAEGASPERKALARSKAILHRCKGDLASSERCEAAARTGGSVPAASDGIRVRAVAAAALAGQHRTADALREWKAALELAAYGPDKTDPAARALAVTGNNLACDLEGKKDRTAEETALMLEAATTARRFWEVAGGWREVSMADYRLAMSLMAAGQATTALTHAALCLALIEANGSDPGELFFAREVMARASQAVGDRAGALSERDRAAETVPGIADEGTRDYCKSELAKLDADLAGAQGSTR